MYREDKRKALKRQALTCLKVGTIITSAILVVAATLTYHSYRSFARLIDLQIAGGYLRSHAGLYAAPRIIEKGACLSKDHLALALQRAGYAPETASNIWNGSFQTREQSIRILPRQGTETYHWVDVNFNENRSVTS